MSTSPTAAAAARAVRFDRYGGRKVLSVRDVPMPRPAAGEVLVEVRAAAINPGEVLIRSGALHERLPATFPSGEGSDLAGIVVATGPGVQEFVAGDAVLGYSWTRSSHATHTAVPAAQLIPKPDGLAWEVAGALYVAGCSAYAAVGAVATGPGGVVAVSAATGGVGTLVVQLLTRRGVRVLGIASQASAVWLTAHGATPVEYGDGIEDRLRAAAPEGINAFIDLFGPEYIHLATDLGLPPDRIETIVVSPAAVELGVRMDGAGAVTAPREVLAELADLLASGEIELPITATYPLDRVADAFAHLERRHTLGKIVLLP